MKLRLSSSRWALWACVAALLLNSAMPLLASVSAQLQGKTLVEVCTVYGVARVPLADAGHAPVPDPVADHTGKHCALSGLTALAALDVATPAVALTLPRRSRIACTPATSAVHDRCAAWVARLRHGPPARA